MILFGLLGLMLRPTPARAQPDVTEILKKVSETYTSVSEYELVAEQTVKLSANKAPIRARTRIAFKGPNRYRLEGTIPGLDPNNPDLDETIMIHDGSALWFYLPKSNQFYFIPAAELATDREGSAHTPEATDSVAMQKYRLAAKFADGAKLLREDEIEVAGTKVRCYVVSVPEKWPGPYTWWVDKKSYRIFQEVTADGTTVYATIKLGDPQSDSLFTFEPPPGARKMTPSTFGR